MKKFLLSALTLTAAAAAWATVPEFGYFASKPVSITLDNPTYSNPACASANNNLFITAGLFDEGFEFSTKYKLEPGISTSAYVLAYDVNCRFKNEVQKYGEITHSP